MTDDREAMLRALALAYLAHDDGGNLGTTEHAAKFFDATEHIGHHFAATCPACFADEARSLAEAQLVALEPLIAARRAAARREEREACVQELEDLAKRYELDGEPGDLGAGCWGWRDIAFSLRRIAAAIRAREDGDG